MPFASADRSGCGGSHPSWHGGSEPVGGLTDLQGSGSGQEAAEKARSSKPMRDASTLVGAAPPQATLPASLPCMWRDGAAPMPGLLPADYLAGFAPVRRHAAQHHASIAAGHRRAGGGGAGPGGGVLHGRAAAADQGHGGRRGRDAVCAGRLAGAGGWGGTALLQARGRRCWRVGVAAACSCGCSRTTPAAGSTSGSAGGRGCRSMTQVAGQAVPADGLCVGPGRPADRRGAKR